MKPILKLFSFAIAAFLGFRLGLPLETHLDSQEPKPFAIVLYAYKQGQSIEKTLRSIFEQDYENFRVIFFDDNSKDETFEKARVYVLENNQESKVIMIQNQDRLGPVACMSQGALMPQEIVIPLQGGELFAHPGVLKKLNAAYQDPHVLITQSTPLLIPSYEPAALKPISFYASLFQEIRLCDLIDDGQYKTGQEAYLIPILQMSQGHQKKMEETLLLSKPTRVSSDKPHAPYPAALFAKPEDQKADIVIFSSDRPLQLFACLESTQRYLSGYQDIYVLYKANDRGFIEGYEQLVHLFPQIHFVAQDCKKDFQPKLLQILKFCSPYVLFATDDDLVKEPVNLKLCMEAMEKTKAYGFYLRLGENITYCYQSKKEQTPPKSLDLGNGVFAWTIQIGDSDWEFPNTLDMTLYKKKTLLKAFEKMHYKTPNSLEFSWAKDFRPQGEIGLFFQKSKILNIPLNVVGKTGNPHMNYMTPLELLAKFEEGYKIDINPLYKIENNSPHYEYYPTFVPR